MKLQYASDLHLEFPQNAEFLKNNPLKPIGDILLLVGDIVPFAIMDKHIDFFSFLSDNFQTTYWIPGNHEYYYYDIAEKSGILNVSIKSNVILANNISFIHDNVKIVMSTLWSHISPENQWYIQNGMSDYQVIKYKGEPFSIDHYNQLHDDSLVFLKRELGINNTEKTVIATHHVPTFLNYPEKYKTDILNQAFAVELFDLIEIYNPSYWVYGHIHHNTPNFKIGKTQLVTNQLGYVKYNEQAEFDTNKYFVI